MKKYLIILVIIAITGVSVASFMSDYIWENGEIKYIRLFVYILTLIGFLVELVMVFLIAASRDTYRKRDEFKRKFIRYQKDNYEYLKNREEDTKKFRDEFKKNIDIIRNLSKEKNYEKLSEFIDRLSEDYDKIPRRINVNNDTASAILNYYFYQCSKNNIRMQVQGKIDECLVKPYDLCIILSNIMSNAFEAQNRIKDVYCGDSTDENVFINVTVGNKSGRLIIEEENAIIDRNEAYKTTKSDKQNHGYGLKNIRKKVSEYSGIMDISDAERVFQIRIVI